MTIDVIRTIVEPVKPPVEHVTVTFSENEFLDLQVLVNDGLRFGGKGAYASASDKSRYNECTKNRMTVGKQFLSTRL